MAETWWVMGVTPAYRTSSSFLRSLPFMVGTSHKCSPGKGGSSQRPQASEQTGAGKDEERNVLLFSVLRKS